MTKIIKKSRSPERFERFEKIGVLCEFGKLYTLQNLGIDYSKYQMHFYIYIDKDVKDMSSNHFHIFSAFTEVNFFACKNNPDKLFAVKIGYPKQSTEDVTDILRDSIINYWEDKVKSLGALVIAYPF